MTEPGLTLSRQAPVDADAVATLDDVPPGELWGDLAEGLIGPFTRAVRELLEDVHAGGRSLAMADVLEADDGETLMYTSVWGSLAEDRESGRHQEARDLFGTFGKRGAGPIAVDGGLDTIGTVVMPVLEKSSSTPTVAVMVDRAFRDRRADHRRRVCDLLATLASACDVRIVGSGLTLRWLAERHHADLPGDVRSQCSFGRGDTGPVDDVVMAAREALDYDGSAVSVLRALAGEDSETRTYSALSSTLPVTRSTVRNHLSTLRELGLVSESFSIGGETAVELRKAGREFLSALDADIGRQETIEDSVRRTGNSPHHARVATTSKLGETPPALAAAAAATADATADRSRHHTVEWLSRPEHAAAAGTAPADGVAITDYPTRERQGRLNGGLSYNSVREELVVSAEFVNVLPWRVTLARTLLDSRMFNEILDEERLEDAVGDLVRDHKDVLRGMRCLGYLPDRIDTVEKFVRALQDARNDLLKLTQQLHHEEYEMERQEFRSLICREALGLAGVAVHLLDLADIDVVIECRLPQYSRHFDAERRDTLVETLATEATVFSKYGHHVARRHLYEHREDKRRQVFDPTIDAENPFGDLVPSYSIVGAFGSKEESFATALEDALEAPGDLHDDAPEFAVPVTVTTDTKHNRERTAGAARRVLEAKHLDLTREALSVLTAFATTPYDVADALSQLSVEEFDRDIRVNEVRFALAHLETDRLLPDASPTVRAALSALFAADAPLSRTELADRADVTARSLRSHLDVLLGLDVVEETPEGLRLSLSFHTDGERYVDVLPTIVTDDLRFARDAVYETLERLGIDDPAVWEVWIVASSGVPDVDRLVERFDWLRWALLFLRALGDQSRRLEEHTRRTAFGASIEQASLQVAADDVAADGRIAT